MNLDHMSYAESNSKWTIELNVRAKTIKLLKTKKKEKNLWLWDRQKFLRIQKT